MPAPQSGANDSKRAQIATIAKSPLVFRPNVYFHRAGAYTLGRDERGEFAP